MSLVFNTHFKFSPIARFYGGSNTQLKLVASRVTNYGVLKVASRPQFHLAF
jgi:hypothetical protein